MPYAAQMCFPYHQKGQLLKHTGNTFDLIIHKLIHCTKKAFTIWRENFVVGKFGELPAKLSGEIKFGKFQ